MIRVPSNTPTGAGEASGLSILSAEASVELRDRRVVQRELLRVENERRFELRPGAGEGLVLMDFGPGVLNASILAKVRCTAEIEFVLLGMGDAAIDLWCTGVPAANAQVSLIDAYGRLVVPEVASRDPSMPPVTLMPGRYMLDVRAWEGTTVLRMARSLRAPALRAVV